MNYIDVYFSRINHLGDTISEKIRNGGIRSFEKWLNESPHTISNLSVERGLYFKGIIQTNKDKEHEKIMFLYVSNDIPLLVGDILNWPLDNGEEEKWLLIQEEKKVNGTYRTFWIVRCNYLMKWIDSDGHLQQSWAYFVSSLDSTIKGNFRTWNDLITPQPNKYAELIMPKYSINRSTNFIVEEESWTVVEYDHTSVPGVIYLSLTENKVNLIYDDIINDIADLDKLAKYSLLLPEGIQYFSIGSKIEPKFTIMKNGEPFEINVNILPLDKSYINNELIALKEGDTEILIKSSEYPIEEKISVRIINEEQENLAYIKGKDTIKLDRQEEYTLITTKEEADNVEFYLDNSAKEFASINMITGNKCIIKANKNNKLGNFILNAKYMDKIYQKNISIVPLW